MIVAKLCIACNNACRDPLPKLKNTHIPQHEKILLFCSSILGKTLLAKAVANQTAATFLRVVGSELIQKYLVRNRDLDKTK